MVFAVLIKIYSRRSTSTSNYFSPIFSRPYQIVNKLDSIYTIQNLVAGKFITTHINNLRTNPIDIAVQNRGEFFIDSILEHRGDHQRRSTMEFKVRWLGYDPNTTHGNHTKSRPHWTTDLILGQKPNAIFDPQRSLIHLCPDWQRISTWKCMMHFPSQSHLGVWLRVGF